MKETVTLTKYCWKSKAVCFWSVTALQLFTITEQNGILLTRASLRGMSGEYRMRVIATDGGVPPLRSALPIIVKVQGAQDDDGTPQWSSPDNNYIVYVQEVRLGCADWA